MIWLEDRGPVFYKQRRSGWLGMTIFTLFKLRTMREHWLWTCFGLSQVIIASLS